MIIALNGYLSVPELSLRIVCFRGVIPSVEQGSSYKRGTGPPEWLFRQSITVFSEKFKNSSKKWFARAPRQIEKTIASLRLVKSQRNVSVTIFP